MGDIQIFSNNEFGEVRTIVIDNEPWFVGIDVAKALGYKKPTGAITNNVDKDDTLTEGVTDSMGRLQNTLVVNESGLYALIFGSKLDSAKKFKKWVTSEVLPSIRKTGSYGVPQTIPEQIQLLAQGNVELNQRVDEVTEDVKSVKEEMQEIKDNLPILPLEADNIVKAVKKRGVEVLGGKESPAYNDRALRQKLYNDLYANLKHNFEVRTYKAIRRKDADKAVQIVNEYKPPLFLSEQIENANAQQSLDLEGGAIK